MESLDHLNRKIEALLKRFTAASAENKKLKESLTARDAENKRLREKLASLEGEMVSVHLGKTVNNEDEKDNMRRQLDTVIAEIDKILNTLND